MTERKVRISDPQILGELAEKMNIEGVRVPKSEEVDWYAPQGPTTLTDEALTSLFSQIESITEVEAREAAMQDVTRGLNLRFGISEEQLNERLSTLKI